jgi:ribosome-binding protein aMBF1 (putative translation factor)
LVETLEVRKMATAEAAVEAVGNTAEEARARRRARSAEYRAEEAALAPYEALARLVIKHRIELGLTQEQLAERMDTSHSAISRLESGQHQPNLRTMHKLGQALGMKLVIGFETEAGDRELVPG